MSVISHVRVIGSGLIGTSIGLAVSAQKISVTMLDSDPQRAILAQALVGQGSTKKVDLVIIATPSSALKEVIEGEYALNPSAAFIDIASVKTKPQREIATIAGLASRFCGTHPLAGREVGGPESARADLFQGRSWVISPSAATSREVTALATSFIQSLGATVIVMDPDKHDSYVALISHLPQISASLLASQLVSAPSEAMALSGQGLKDSTRIAGSDPILWGEILSDNKEHILPLLEKLHQDLGEVIAKIDDLHTLEKLIRVGQVGRNTIPGKHGGLARNYAFLPIVIEDKAGQLAALFQECADAGVNIEDLSIEHSPGQFSGLITLAIAPYDVEKLTKHLLERQWNVHPAR